ncbi:hypothetical protein CkaCkLH20_08936 [Colletotrichum karsti]|uniref:Uncharacterized protein n=1 Tax=Colletotrichum karsti TaxID=1095194 RepID=A0A9P6HY83_9PEZI|nr:uncharacterized protein CkaCkLH20_08936 [Colletotrichum karsti]KAF9873477.1 hypothetical protein CkaCkLH20_08936 [Colletotrichum karsti]
MTETSPRALRAEPQNAALNSNIFSLLPYEIFLNIFDILFAEATSSPEPIVWNLFREDNLPEQFYLTVPREKGNYSSTDSPESRSKRRHNAIRSVSQINQYTRAMIYRKFSRLRLLRQPYKHLQPSTRKSTSAWVIPSIDVFMPQLWDGRRWSTRTLMPDLTSHLLPLGLQTIRCVETIGFEDAHPMLCVLKHEPQSLASMPNLRALTLFYDGNFWADDDGPRAHSKRSFQLIKGEGRSRTDVLVRYARLWRPMTERFVRLTLSAVSNRDLHGLRTADAELVRSEVWMVEGRPSVYSWRMICIDPGYRCDPFSSSQSATRISNKEEMGTPIRDSCSSKLTTIPYELFLHIIEYIIVGAAEACMAPNTWYMGYLVDELKENNQIINHHTTSKNAEGNQINGESNSNKPASNQDKGEHDASSAVKDKWWPREAQFCLYGNYYTGIERHQVTRLASQINRQTRAMTHRTFLRFPVKSSPVEAWLLLEIDEFILNLSCSDRVQMPFPFASSLALRDTMLHPTPGLKNLFENIRNIHIESVALFQEANIEDMKAILALKRLKQIRIRIGEVDESGLHLAQKNEMIDWYFPDLLSWELNHGSSFARLWKPFRDRNVRLVAEDKEEGYWMQLFDTPNGIRIVFPFDGFVEEYDSEEY